MAIRRFQLAHGSLRTVAWGWRLLFAALVGQAVELSAQGFDKTGRIERHPPPSDWAFLPIHNPAPPRVKDPRQILTPVDAFILARLDEAGLGTAPLVSRRTFIRRATFDVTGLPPTPDEVEDFVNDTSPQAYEKVVDRLLASPQYGERWARHWLDVVRYAETDGFAIDEERPTLWRYRDYVVRVLNEDRPFDRFICEQLAGDELGAGSEGVVATGFYRLGPWEEDNMVPENKRQDYLNEITDTIGTAFLGLTVGCARCHDHKYDPISTVDYYQMQAFLAPLLRSQLAAELLPVESAGDFQPQKLKAEAELARRREALSSFKTSAASRFTAALKKPIAELSNDEFDEAFRNESTFTGDEKKKFEELKTAVSEYKGPQRFAPVACAVSNPDPDDAVPATHVLKGGSVASPGQKVSPGFPARVPPWSAECYSELARIKPVAAGRRKTLAQWIASPANPLTARVLANRLWQYHFGAGIVATPNDFGRNGSRPSHPELLDYLASRLLENGWRLKPLHRLLLLSRTYQISTQHPESEACAKLDPDNRLLWRSNFRRLEGEVLRDALLAVSGRLRLVPGGPGFYEELPAEMGRDFPFFKWDPSEADQRARRSLYLFQRRNMVVPMLESFDAADMSASCARRSASVTTPQVFTLFNSKFAHETSRHFAQTVLNEVGASPRRQVERVFRGAFGRPPTVREWDAGTRFLENAAGDPTPDGHPPQALADLCLVMINANEFLYLE